MVDRGWEVAGAVLQEVDVTLAPGAHLTSRHELPDVVLQGGPPKAPPNELAGPGGSGMTGELAGVTPHENPAPDGLGDEE